MRKDVFPPRRVRHRTPLGADLDRVELHARQFILGGFHVLFPGDVQIFVVTGELFREFKEIFFN